MFYEISGERFKQVLREEDGVWLISYDNPISPKFVLNNVLNTIGKIEAPTDFIQSKDKNLTEGQKSRLNLIFPLINSETYISDRAARNEKIKEIAETNHTTVRRIQKLYYRYLAGRSLVEEREPVVKPETDEQRNFAWAIDTFYYSAKKLSLRTVYDLLLLSRYTDADGHLKEDHPTWHTFRHYFYNQNYHRKVRNGIARNGLSNYQRNCRPLFGSACGWKNQIGAFQMDETQADIYLVSRLDKRAVIGRPNIYMAVDTATQLIAGIYVGLDAGEQAVISCLANAAMDKVEFCKRYGIEITKDMWPNTGLPGEIITDKGKEFIGSRMNELAMKFGMEFQSLPPFRPDGKGLVEKSFDLLQQKYKPLLRGKGVIEEDAQERWATDYRSQAVLTLEDFTKVIIHCVLYLNSCRIIEGYSGKAKDAEPVAARLWNWYEEQGESSIIPVSQEQLYLMSLPRKSATLTRKGITIQGLTYVSRDYKKLIEEKPIGANITIAYDPENVNHIYFIDGLNYLPFELASFCRQYAGATQAECQMEKNKHRSRKKDLERLDTEGRITMIQNIQAIIGGTEHHDKGKLNSSIIQKNREREAAR